MESTLETSFTNMVDGPRCLRGELEKYLKRFRFRWVFSQVVSDKVGTNRCWFRSALQSLMNMLPANYPASQQEKTCCLYYPVFFTTCVDAYVYAYNYVYICTHTDTHQHVYMYVCTYVCVYLHMYLCIYTCAFIYT